MKTKKHKTECCHPCLCCNESAMEILASAIQAETDRIGDAANDEDWGDCLIFTRRLLEILEALDAHTRTRKAGKR